jgi:acyl-homoserine-lactone acylase
MEYRSMLYRSLIVAVVVGSGFWLAGGAELTIYRDSWGVPHVVADSEAAAAYGLGYAQAEDRLGDIYINIRTAIGRMAEAFGPEHVERDYYMRAVKNAERCEAYWPAAPDHLKALAQAFIDGVKAYTAEHPDRVPEWALELEGWHPMAIGRAMILSWPLGAIMGELSNRANPTGRSSNQWAVAPARSADGYAILLTDPHLTWESLAVFYEATVHSPTLIMNGYFIAGSPLLGLGHNEHVGWACTTGGPDTADVFEVKLNPQNPLQYEYDGEYHNAELNFISIPVKDGTPVQRPVAYTRHGMLVSEPDVQRGVAYVGATPYLESMGLFEQMYRMCLARNSDELYEALGMNELMEQNVMFADTRGNIQYVRTGRVPIRPEGYNWSAPVPGSTSETAWKGIHPIEDLVQIKNPPQGYMQNCNISPANMMIDSPLKPENYRDYIYNVSWDKTNTRGRRAIELLAANDAVTKEAAKAIAMDVYDVRAPEWRAALERALTNHGAAYTNDARFAKAVDLLLAWDGLFVKSSTAAPVVMYWRLQARDTMDAAAIAAEEPLDEENQKKLLDALQQALTTMDQVYDGKWVAWGDVLKVGRGGIYFPVDGADFGGGAVDTRTLFDVAGAEDPPGSGRFIANNGSMSMLLMFMDKDGIESYSCIPWGQSADPASPHYMDQGEKLYSQRQFKKTLWTREAILSDVASKKTLAVQ